MAISRLGYCNMFCACARAGVRGVGKVGDLPETPVREDGEKSTWERGAVPKTEVDALEAARAKMGALTKEC